jgi:hypothetical protein
VDYAAYPEWLRTKEDKLCEKRRRLAGCESTHPDRYARAEDRIGLALSGGGIRSATFALGVLRALAEAKALRRVDFLSTVSGGGYIGSFLGALYLEESRRSGKRTQDGDRSLAPDHVEAALIATPDSMQVAWLRENGRYLAPSGTGANWLAGASLIRNWIALMVVFVVSGLAVACVGFLVKGGLLRMARLVPGHPLEMEEIAPLLGGVWLSPFVWAAVGVFFLATIPGTAYWAIRIERRGHIPWRRLGIGIVATTLAVMWWGRVEEAARGPMYVVLGWLVVTAALWAVARGWVFDASGKKRFQNTRAVAVALRIIALTLFVAVVDSLGQTLYAHVGASAWGTLGATLGAAQAVVVSANKVLAKVGDRNGPIGKATFGALAVDAAAFLLLVAMGTVISALVHELVWRGHLPTYVARDVGRLDRAWAASELVVFAPNVVASFFLCGAVTFLIGQFHRFVHGSSLASFYASRLARAYLGAANPQRLDSRRGGKVRDTAFSRTEPIDGDRIDLDDYAPHLEGGPLHLINVTINETYDARSKLLEPDRTGLPMAIGPLAIDVGVHHHAARRVTVGVDAQARGGMTLRCQTWVVDPEKKDETPFRVFPDGGSVTAERLDLADWVALSGAAVAPGLGPRTRVSRSILATAFNLRLGGWWDSGVHTPAPGFNLDWALQWVPAYASLYDEAFARFPGTARSRWYLSDGGHFENTGCYELIRRRMELIVCSDAGADPDYLFEDIGNLVRLARVDFGAEIEFLDEATLATFVAPTLLPAFGTLAQLREAAKVPASPTLRCAALARIRYAPDRCWRGAPRSGLLLVIKPLVGGLEPRDVLGYRADHAAFPQESTAEQFFDDAQWEAYRRLGEEAGRRLFRAKKSTSEAGWTPRDMRYSHPA